MSRRDDAGRMSAYNYADRRDGERSGYNPQQNVRVRSPLRDNTLRDRNRDRGRNLDRERSPGASGRRNSADFCKESRDGAQGRDRFQQNGGLSPPRGPASHRPQEPPRGPGLNRSATAPNPSAFKAGSLSTAAQQSDADVLLRLFRNVVTPVTDRTLLKKQRQEVEKACVRQRMELEKGASKHNDFPSVRDVHAHATKKLDLKMEVLNKELEHNNTTLNNETRIWLEKLLELAAHVPPTHARMETQPQQQGGVDSRLDALEKRMVDRETAWEEKQAVRTKQHDDALAKQAERISALEANILDAKGHIQSLQNENAALKSELKTAAASPVRPTPEVPALAASQTLQALVDTMRDEMRALMAKVDEATAPLADTDMDFINESCTDINVKLPVLESEVNRLKEMESKLVTIEQHDQSCSTVQDKLNNMAVLFGNLIKKDRAETDTRFASLETSSRQLSLPAPGPAASAASPDGLAAPEALNTVEERERALEEVRQGNPATGAASATPGARSSIDMQDTTNRLQALEARVESHESMLFTKDKVIEHALWSADSFGRLMGRTDDLEARCKANDDWQQQIKGSITQVEDTIKSCEKWMNGQVEGLLLSLSVLDSQYNNLTTEGLAQMIGGHIQNQDHETVTRLQERNDEVGQLLSAMDRRIKALETVGPGHSPEGGGV
ncbi:hypothetical protein VDGD_08914 [Verticillium dahliae]|nr:hypothetical protein VdG1_00883 [Verticillium dahliae VDG1]RBQ83484.1 hypothetical protein VDGD_08914 [Verticillium dahliae]